jgi:hypothetical protein
VADPALAALPDEQILARAASTGRALVTANIKDLVPLDGRNSTVRRSPNDLVLTCHASK